VWPVNTIALHNWRGNTRLSTASIVLYQHIRVSAYDLTRPLDFGKIESILLSLRMNICINLAGGPTAVTCGRLGLVAHVGGASLDARSRVARLAHGRGPFAGPRKALASAADRGERVEWTRGAGEAVHWCFSTEWKKCARIACVGLPRTTRQTGPLSRY
jgi:hypothetical protein